MLLPKTLSLVQGKSLDMKLFLARQRSGLYMLCAIRPKLHRVGDTSDDDWYMRPGEPIGYRHLCAEGVALLISEFKQLEPLDIVEVEISAKQLK